MRKTTINKNIQKFLVAMAAMAGVCSALAQSEFTYQGQLTSGGSPVTGTYNLQFSLYTSSTGGTPVAGPVLDSGVAVANGLFTTTVNFGSYTLSSGPYWLEIDAEAGGASSFTTLSPRQQITPVPQSLFALNAGTAASATSAISATTAGGFSGSLNGDVTGPQNATVVSSVGGQNAASIASAVAAANAATSAGTRETVVMRDSTGSFSANSLTLSGYLVVDGGLTLPFPAILNSSEGNFLLEEGGLYIGLQNGNYAIQSGLDNTAVGDYALAREATTSSANNGSDNTAIGEYALQYNTTGSENTAVGSSALGANTTGYVNTAIGQGALFLNTTGSYNTAAGSGALVNNTIGSFDTAIGLGALQSNTKGSNNTAIGFDALQENTTGQYNIALGYMAGQNLTTGNYNLDIGNPGVAGESLTIRIGAGQSSTYIAGIYATPISPGSLVGVTSSGQLGTLNTVPSSALSGGYTGAVNFNNGNNAFTGNGSALTSLNASQLTTGVLPSSALSGTYYNQLTLNSSLNSFAGSGAGLTSLNASQLTSGTVPSSVLSGTYAGQLTFDNSLNSFTGNGAGLANVSAAKLATGAASGAGSGNVVNSGTTDAFIGGGLDNGVASANYAAIAGGWENIIASGSSQSFIGAGSQNEIQNNCVNSVIGGGANNDITSGTSYSVIAGGQGNVSFVGNSFIGGGQANNIYPSADHSAIAGGWANCVSNSAYDSFIGGGVNNTNTGVYSVIGGGYYNLSGPYSVVPGGFENVATGNTSFAAGAYAQAANDHCFVWSDGSSATTSTAASQFVARASGGFNFQLAGNTQVSISPNGTLSTPVLTITGGADVAEPFKMAGDTIPSGSVVIIDEEHPGQLKLGDRPYDTRVAGIVSGANGIHPGIQMQQQGLLEGGRNVALSGRVYVMADSSNGEIQPGDLLTTSAVPGHAMKVTDHVKAQGAVLGKAMSSLRADHGMVLVLVTLQ